MGCNQSRQKVNKDVEVRRKFQIGLHLTKEEAGVQVAFGKTSRKKYETPSVLPEVKALRDDMQGDTQCDSVPPVPSEPADSSLPSVRSVPQGFPSVIEVMRRDE